MPESTAELLSPQKQVGDAFNYKAASLIASITLDKKPKSDEIESYLISPHAVKTLGSKLVGDLDLIATGQRVIETNGGQKFIRLLAEHKCLNLGKDLKKRSIATSSANALDIYCQLKGREDDNQQNHILLRRVFLHKLAKGNFAPGEEKLRRQLIAFFAKTPGSFDDFSQSVFDQCQKTLEVTTRNNEKVDRLIYETSQNNNSS